MADSTSLPRLHIGLSVSWNFEFMLSQIPSPSRIRVIYLIPIGSWESKNELEEVRMNFSMLLLKIL